MPYKSLHRNLLSWYQRFGRRDLPWRLANDPYAVYISEIMLQQTQVRTVLEKGYYHRFLEHFPNLRILSDASLEDVLLLWQGLGYYRRARHLHEAAKQMNGSIPSTYETLITLPGIGRSTAHAILALGHHRPFSILDANIKRVLRRFFALFDATDTMLWNKADALLDRLSPFDYNQAMMDIGSMVCLPSKPLCHLCPLAQSCEGKHNPEQYTQISIKKTTPTRHQTIVIFENQHEKLFMQQRQGAFLTGLYRFAEYDEDESVDFEGSHYLRKNMQLIGGLRHVYSHFKLDAAVYHQKIISKVQKGWHMPSQLNTIPCSNVERKALMLLKAYQANCVLDPI